MGRGEVMVVRGREESGPEEKSNARLHSHQVRTWHVKKWMEERELLQKSDKKRWEITPNGADSTHPVHELAAAPHFLQKAGSSQQPHPLYTCASTGMALFFAHVRKAKNTIKSLQAS